MHTSSMHTSSMHTSSAEEHRDAAQRALESAQRNPIMSADQFFAVAQVHALLAIEQRLARLVDVPAV